MSLKSSNRSSNRRADLHLFLDTGIYLSFYHYGKDDLDELDKLIGLVESEMVALYLPQQVQYEYIRNRENKFADALKRFTDSRLEKSFPRMFQDYEPEYSQIKESVKTYEDTSAVLLRKLKEDFNTFSLKADKVISALFKSANKVEDTLDIFSKAHKRHLRGNPPGKKDSIGDSLNWECLLSVYELTGKDIWIVAEDKDWRGLNSDDVVSPFLAWEWKEEKRGSVKYYRTLTSFFGANFPDIKLMTQRQKERLIEELKKSSASGMKAIISKLLLIGDFSDDEVLQIVDTVTRKSFQLDDSDDLVALQESVKQIVRGRESLIDNQFKNACLTLLGRAGGAPESGPD